MRKFIITALFFGVCLTAFSQSNTSKDSVLAPSKPSFVILDITGGFFYNLGDLASRYPYFTCVPLGVEYQHQQNWVAGVNYNIYLGSQVNTAGIFDNISTASGDVLDINGHPAVIRAYMRGFSARAYVGKIIPLNWNKAKNKPHWSLQASIGGGYQQHYISYQFDEGNLTQIEGNNMAGYDRKSEGWQINERLRLQYLNTQTLCFVMGLDCYHGITKSIRPYDFSSGSRDVKSYSDIMLGIHAGVIIPIPIRQANAVPDYYLE